MRQKREAPEVRAPKSGAGENEGYPGCKGPKSGSAGENGVRNLTNCAARKGAPFSPETPFKTRDGDVRKRAAGAQLAPPV